jgi:hypothetical protein
LHASQQRLDEIFNIEKTDPSMCAKGKTIAFGRFRSQHCGLKTHDSGKGICTKALATEIDQKETASQQDD